MTRVYRSGVRFDCEVCGSLLRDCDSHHEGIADGCTACGGTLRLVGVGNALVEHARWYRCANCFELHMNRRGDVVPATPKNGFAEFT